MMSMMGMGMMPCMGYDMMMGCPMMGMGKVQAVV